LRGMIPVTHIPGWERYIFGLVAVESSGEEAGGGVVAVPFVFEPRVKERSEALRGVRFVRSSREEERLVGVG